MTTQCIASEREAMEFDAAIVGAGPAGAPATVTTGAGNAGFRSADGLQRLNVAVFSYPKSLRPVATQTLRTVTGRNGLS